MERTDLPELPILAKYSDVDLYPVQYRADLTLFGQPSEISNTYVVGVRMDSKWNLVYVDNIMLFPKQDLKTISLEDIFKVERLDDTNFMDEAREMSAKVIEYV
jgi:hypothetical protein